MERYHHFINVFGFILLSLIVAGCGAKQTGKPIEAVEFTCVRGAVWYRSPTDATLIRFPYAKITAWRHETDDPLGETQADESGNYCIEVPAGDFGVDLRVWGLKKMGSVSYTCTGSADAIKVATGAMKCSGECIETDIVADCSEFIPRRRSWDY
jgi:hypothetical protein